ncbi:S41 family peptidase [Chitinophaga eiseniae]|uniref:Peptidase S41 n=1 Tax=Chitinophaga eiseniae TaxID=634771 RepID=A0A847SNU7_9BACT|nr:S41 family peptidase [Chitinophaga eiseniae]NLR81503.1 peptidase S41 [Chitinophaga eiseniae]
MKTGFLLLFTMLPLLGTAQSKLTFDGSFEQANAGTGLPDGWMKWGTHYQQYLDTQVVHSGRRSLCLTPGGAKGTNDFGSSAIAIPVAFSGEKITLTGYLKLENVESGVAGLIMRIDDKDNKVQEFNNMQQDKIHGTADWKQYSITLPLPRDAKTLYVGALTNGTGKVWADDLEITVDGKPLSKAPPRNVYKADSDTAFDGGSGIDIPALTPLQARHLEVLGKVWGFLKYYHPAIGNGDYNWDYELFRILPAVLQAGTEAARNGVLLSWVNKLGPAALRKEKKVDDSKLKMLPDLDWIRDEKTLGRDLSVVLENVADMRREDEQYYVQLYPTGNPQFLHENSYSNMLYPDAGFRLLALFRYWNMVQYYFPYKYLVTEGWQPQLAKFIPLFVQAKDVAAYQTALQELIASIHDSHASLYGPNLYIRNRMKSKTLPVRIKFVEEKAMVMKTTDPNLALRKGDVITAINQEAVADIVKRLLPTTSASNYPTQLSRIENYLLLTKDSILTITYERNGEQYTAALPTVPGADNYVRGDQPATSWHMIGNDIGYVYPGLFKNTQMDSVKQAFANTRGMVIDLRCYPSDDMLGSLALYVLPERQTFVKFTTASTTSPGLFTVTYPMSAGGKNKDPYKGKVVILVNETTQSNAEFVTMALRLAPRATVMGSTTAGADGNVSYLALPGGLNSLFTGIGVYYPNGEETQRVGIKPDIIVIPTVKGIRENRDEVLEKALSLIRE